MIASSVDSNFWRSILEVKYPSLVSKRSGVEEDRSSRMADDEDEEKEGKLTKLRMQTNAPYTTVFILEF